MENINNELLEKAKQAKSAEEILALAKQNGMELTEEQAKAYYAQFHPTSGELSDDELDNVAGGGCHSRDGRLVVTNNYSCSNYEKNFKDFEINLIEEYPEYAEGQGPGWCMSCKHHTVENGLWLCNHPANKH